MSEGEESNDQMEANDTNDNSVSKTKKKNGSVSKLQQLELFFPYSMKTLERIIGTKFHKGNGHGRQSKQTI